MPSGWSLGRVVIIPTMSPDTSPHASSIGISHHILVSRNRFLQNYVMCLAEWSFYIDALSDGLKLVKQVSKTGVLQLLQTIAKLLCYF